MGRVKLKVRDMKIETLDSISAKIENKADYDMCKTDSDMKLFLLT